MVTQCTRTSEREHGVQSAIQQGGLLVRYAGSRGPETRIVRTSWEPVGGCTSFCPAPVVARRPGTAVEVLSPGGGPDPLLGTRLHGEFRAGANPSPVEENGWLLLRTDRLGDVPNQLRSSLEGYRLLGLPLIGSRIISYVNFNAEPGVLANYSTALPMSGDVQCVDAQQQPCAPWLPTV